jgi:ABC-2 type transport system permease protein
MTAIQEIFALFWHDLRLTLRNPVWIVFAIAQPLVFLVFFGPLATRALGSSGVSASHAWQTFVPGVLLQLSLFGAAFTGFTVITDLQSGVLERLRVTPVSRAALLLGRVLRDVVILLAQAALLLLVSVPFGLRANVPAIAISLGLVALISLSLASLSSALALKLKTEEALGPLFNTVLLPLLLLSGALLPMSLAPSWLSDISRATPFRYVLEALRGTLQGHFGAIQVAEGAAVAAAMCALATIYGIATFARQGA